MMKLLFDDDLMESVVFHCASGKRRGVPPLQVRRFHAERERAYSILDPDARNAAFGRVNQTWFREWGMESWLAKLLASFPLLEPTLRAFIFRKARHKFEEGGDLYVNPDGERHGIVAVRPERFEGQDLLIPFLQHELMHLSDMVDPAFGYSPDLGEVVTSSAQFRLVRERYRLLWDVTIDGRLTRSERATVATLEQRRAEFDRAFGFLEAEKRAKRFESLWNGDAPRHGDLVAVAGDPREVTDTPSQTPGALCPLCGFATFEWVEVSALKAEYVAAIRREFPHWNLEQGACRRCAEIYESGAGLELPSTICV